MFKKLLKPVLISLAILLLLVAVFVGLVYAGVFGQLYSREELKRFKMKRLQWYTLKMERSLGSSFLKTEPMSSSKICPIM